MHLHTTKAWLHAGRIRHNLEPKETYLQLEPVSKRTRHNARKTQENVDKHELEIMQELVELKCYVGFLWDYVEGFAVDVSSLSCLSACSRWHHARLQARLDETKQVRRYLEKQCSWWYGGPEKSGWETSRILRLIMSIVPSLRPNEMLDPYMARIVGGWFKFFSLPRRPITQGMRDRGDFTEPDSILPQDVDAGLTFLEDEFGWALVFKFRLGDEEPCCYWLHSSIRQEFRGTGKKCNIDDLESWFPSSKVKTARHPGGFVKTFAITPKTTAWLQTLALDGKARTYVAGKLVQVVLCS